MISRIAEHCFWLGRYIERAESTARVLHATGHLALDGDLAPGQYWLPLLTVSGQSSHFVEALGEEATEDSEAVQRYMTWRDDNTASMLCSISLARENARAIREVVSLEVWQTTNELYLWLVGDEGRTAYEHDRPGFYRHIRQHAHLAVGLLESTMLHNTPLDFIWLGMLLERAGQTARTLDTHHYTLPLLTDNHPVVETAIWLSLLRACSGFEPFMKRHQGRVTGDAVVAFLMLEPLFPRSLRYCVRGGLERLASIRAPALPGLPGADAEARLQKLDESLMEMTPASLQREAVHGALSRIVEETDAVCEAIGRELLGRGPA